MCAGAMYAGARSTSNTLQAEHAVALSADLLDGCSPFAHEEHGGGGARARQCGHSVGGVLFNRRSGPLPCWGVARALAEELGRSDVDDLYASELGDLHKKAHGGRDARVPGGT